MSTLHSNDKFMLAAIGMLFAGTLAYGFANDGVLLAATVGGLLIGMAFAAAMLSGGKTGSQVLLPALGMGMVALLIHAARGHAEAHFAVFAFLAVTIVYRHWLPVVVAAGVIAVHHLSFNFFQQWGWGPICFTEPSLGKVLEHAAYVVAEAVILVFLALRAQADFRTAQEITEISEGLVDADGTIRFDAVHGNSAAPTTSSCFVV